MISLRSRCRRFLFLVAATKLSRADWYAETHDNVCDGPFRTRILGIGNRANIFAEEVVDFSIHLPNAKTRFPAPEHGFLRIGDVHRAFVDVRLNRLFRYMGSIILIVLTAATYGFPFSVPMAHVRRPRLPTNLDLSSVQVNRLI